MQDKLQAHRLLMRNIADHVEGGKVGNQISRSGRNPAGQAMRHEGESAKIVGEAADDEQRKRKDRRKQRRRKRRKQQSQRTDDEELEDDEVERDQDERVRPGEPVGDVKQGAENSDGHEKCIHHERAGEAEKFADNELPPAHRAREHGVKRALLNFLGDKADADKDGNHHAKKRNRSEAEIDYHQTLDINGNLADENSGAGQQQREGDQVVKDAVANRFAERIARDMDDPGGHACVPATVPAVAAAVVCSFSTK